MKFIFSTFAVFALGLSVLTACQETASPTAKVETAKQTNANAAPNANSNAAPKTDEHGHAGNAVFIDTRAETAYNTEHIKGALNITENNFEEKYKEIPQGKKIIAYCS
jgi:predicted sulfurtransferase